MPDLPLHPALVHLPLGLALVAPLVAIGVSLAFRLGRLPRAAFVILAGLQLVLAGSALAAMLAGHRDERRVERVVGEQVVHAHEERGEALVWAAGVVAAVGIALLLVPARAVGVVAALMIPGTLAVAVLALLTERAGGEIVYRHGGAAAFSAPSGAIPPASDPDDDD